MNSKETTNDFSIDKFFKPKRIVKHKLGKLFYMIPRRDPNKPGRELVVTFNNQFPIIPNLKINYSYYVRFVKKGNFAGNHYHKKKQEIIAPIHGSVTVILENIKTKAKEKILLDSKEYQMFYINSKISHKIIANDKNTIILVLATSQNYDGDEFKYEIN